MKGGVLCVRECGRVGVSGVLAEQHFELLEIVPPFAKIQLGILASSGQKYTVFPLAVPLASREFVQNNIFFLYGFLRSSLNANRGFALDKHNNCVCRSRGVFFKRAYHGSLCVVSLVMFGIMDNGMSGHGA